MNPSRLDYLLKSTRVHVLHPHRFNAMVSWRGHFKVWGDFTPSCGLFPRKDKRSFTCQCYQNLVHLQWDLLGLVMHEAERCCVTLLLTEGQWTHRWLSLDNLLHDLQSCFTSVICCIDNCQPQAFITSPPTFGVNNVNIFNLLIPSTATAEVRTWHQRCLHETSQTSPGSAGSSWGQDTTTGN